MFDSTASVYSHNLRGSSNNIFLPRPRTEAGKRAFSYGGAVLWNSLPSDLRNQPNLELKSFNNVFSKYYYYIVLLVIIELLFIFFDTIYVVNILIRSTGRAMLLK